MDEASHGDAVSQIDLAGYRACRNTWCGELILKEIAERTSGLCVECFRGHLGDSVSEIEVRNRGQRMVRPVRTKVAPKPGKGNRWVSKRAEKANRRAQRRLAMMFPDLYDVLRAEERARFGLEPWPVESIVGAHDGPGLDETLAFARVFAALDEAGVDPDV